MMKLKMTIEEALEFADEWSRGMTFHEGSQGWRVVCLLLAEEVRRLTPVEAAALKTVAAFEALGTAQHAGELLDALRHIEGVAMADEPRDLPGIAHTARAAIAKATGELFNTTDDRPTVRSITELG